MKKIYTTGEVAKLLGININTVIKWFDDNKVQGFRLPGSRERRITHQALVNFMNENSIPLDLLGEAVGSERRKSMRYPADIPVSLVIDDQTYSAHIADISEMGAKVVLPPEHSANFNIGNFKFDLNFLGEPLDGLSATASIANVRPTTNGMDLGILFEKGNGDLAGRIKQAYL